MADHAPAARRGAAVGLVVLAAVILAGVWLAWRYAAEGEQRDAIHVFQYCLLLVIAAVGAGAYGALRKSRAGIVTGIAALVLSALGLLLIL